MSSSVAAPARIYWTWPTMEFDKCAAAWMIRQFVDEEVVFRFHPQGERLAEGAPFDVPGASWARTHRKCATEAVLESTGLEDPALKRIAEMAHLIEIGKWYVDSDPEAREHRDNVRRIIDQTPDPHQCLERTNQYFDRLYETLSATVARPADDEQ